MVIWENVLMFLCLVEVRELLEVSICWVRVWFKVKLFVGVVFKIGLNEFCLLLWKILVWVLRGIKVD